MSGPEQVLYLVVVPAAIVAVIWTLASVGGPGARKRYRPGRSYDFAPVWYLANHAPNPPPEPAGQVKALAAGPARSGGDGGSGGHGPQPTTGGASDRW